MKKTKLVLLMALVTCALFSTVIFTACNKKTTCSSVACRNDGVCTNGKCVCPAGFLGDFCETGVTSYVSYKNNTFTPITLNITNGATTILPVGGSVAFSGTHGHALLGSATTSGAATSFGIDNPGGVVGLLINWDINSDFPSTAGDTLQQPLNVGSTYVYLNVVNKGHQDVIDVHVNSGFTYGAEYGDVTIPNDGKPYTLGYNLAYNGSNVVAQFSNKTFDSVGIALPFTTNQILTVTVSN